MYIGMWGMGMKQLLDVSVYICPYTYFGNLSKFHAQSDDNDDWLHWKLLARRLYYGDPNDDWDDVSSIPRAMAVQLRVMGQSYNGAGVGYITKVRCRWHFQWPKCHKCHRCLGTDVKND